MYYRLILFTLFLLLVGQTGNTFAQETINKSGGLARLWSMGQNQFVEDPFDLKINAAYGAYYDNFLWGDIGSTKTRWGNDGSSQHIGFNFRLNDALTIGAILAKSDQISEMAITSVDPFYLSLDSAVMGFTPNNITEIFGSFKANNIAFGFGISYLTAQNKYNDGADEDNNYERTFTQIGFNAGLIINLPNKSKLDAAMSLILSGREGNYSAQTDEMAEIIIKADGRAFLTISDKIQLVPLVKILLASGTDKSSYSSGPTRSDEVDLPTRMQILLGTGFNYRDENFLFAGGPSIMLTADKETVEGEPDIENTLTSLNWNLGAEWYCTDWLIARIGYKTITGSVTYQTRTSFDKIDERTLTVYGDNDGFSLGLGFRFSGLAIDATVNTDILRQGLNNIGGGGATLGFVSASYAF